MIEIRQVRTVARVRTAVREMTSQILDTTQRPRHVMISPLVITTTKKPIHPAQI